MGGDEYLGFLTATVTEDEAAELFQGTAENVYGLIRNQYLYAEREDGEPYGVFRFDGEKIAKVPFKTVNSRFLGRVKPRNIQQQMALDLLYNSDITVKILTGRYGAGEILCPNAQ